MAFQTLDQVEVRGKTVLVRVDLNVPLKDERVQDLSRLERLVPSLQELQRKEAKIVLVAHLGRPQGERVEALSLRPVAHALSQVLKTNVIFAADCIGNQRRDVVAALEEGQICLLENIRFEVGEEQNDDQLACQLAEGVDLFINDGFSVSHRAHASVDAITHHLPSYAGRLMEEELLTLEKSLGHPTRPILAFIAGSKISTKLALLKNLVKKVDYLFLGGGIANTFLLSRGLAVGASLVEKEMLSVAKDIEREALVHECIVVLPLDVVVALEHDNKRLHQTLGLNDIQSGQKIYDIGPETRHYVKDLLKQVKTVLWNGPLGVFEVPPFHEGTQEIAQAVADHTRCGDVFSVAGGGETVAALNQAGAGSDFSYLSTAGGAFLEWLEGRTLPGIKALEDAVLHNTAVNKHKAVK